MDKKTALTVQRTDPETAVTFIRRYHYSKVLPRLTRHYLGIYEGGQLSGVVLLLLAKGHFYYINTANPRT